MTQSHAVNIRRACQEQKKNREIICDVWVFSFKREEEKWGRGEGRIQMLHTKE
jgi:hypothetical protein